MALSKRHWGYIFIGCGLTFLFIGIISGLIIPKIISKIVDKMMCVDSIDDKDYEDWAKEKPGVVTKLYYWQIKNKDRFLYHREMPELEQRGPYVYKQNSENVDVSFKDKRRSFKSWRKEPMFSTEESCKNCKENDNITVLNMGYLGTMEKFKGDVNFASAHLHAIMEILVSRYFNNSYKQLGNINGSVWLDPGSGWKNPEFGAWLMQSNPKLVNRSFTEIEMKGLYNALMKRETLFGLTDNATVLKNCVNTNPFHKNCGLLFHLKVYSKNQTVASRVILKVLCTNVSDSCFNRSELIPSIDRYITHVSEYTMWYMLHEQDDIVITISQKKLALGYSMTNIRDPKTGQAAQVPGLVMFQKNKSDVSKKVKESSFYTCEADEEKKHQWAAYDGKKVIPKMLFNLSKDQAISGYFFVLPRSKTATKPCVFSHELPMETFEVFVAPLYMKLRVRYKEDTSLHGLELKRFTVTKEDFLNHIAVKYGFIDLINVRRITIFASMPHLLYANVTIPTSFNQKPDEEKHQDIFDVEPVTGLVMRAQLRIQLNIPIKESSLRVARIKPYNITYVANNENEFLHKAIPVVWAEYGGQAKKSAVVKINKKVFGMYRLSCGLLVGLPILGGIFVIVAVVLFVLSAKFNEVTHVNP